MSAAHIPCTSVAFSFIAAEVKKLRNKYVESYGNIRLFASFCHLLDCKLVMFIDIILRQLVILLGMGYNFWTVFLTLGFVAGVVY